MSKAGWHPSCGTNRMATTSHHCQRIYVLGFPYQEMKLALPIAAILLASALLAQDWPADEYRALTRPYTPPSTAAIRVQTDLVLARVVVRDDSGKSIHGLKQDDFELRDNGRKQVLNVFREESFSSEEPPLVAASGETGKEPEAQGSARKQRFVALFFDDLNMTLSDVVPVRKAAVDFIRDRLRALDKVALFTSSATLFLDFTDDRQQALTKLAELRPQVQKADDGSTACPHIGALHAHMMVRMRDNDALNVAIALAQNCPAYRFTTRRDLAAIVQRQAEWVLSMAERFSADTLTSIANAIERLGKAPGERILLLASSGFWSRSMQREQSRVIQFALRREVVINSLDAKGLVTDAPSLTAAPNVLARNPGLQVTADGFERQQREASSDVLSGLALGTGGEFFHNSNDMDRAVRELASPPATSYLIGFEPDGLVPNGSYHTLQVIVPKIAKASIRCRPGYFAPTKEEISKRPQADPFDQAVSSTEAMQAIPLEVHEQVETSAAGEKTLRILLRVDVRKMPFQKKDDRHVERIRYATVIFSPDGQFLAGSQAMFYLSLKPTTLAQMEKSGLLQKVSMQLPAGNYRIRHVVQEAVEGKIAAQSRDIAVQ